MDQILANVYRTHWTNPYWDCHNNMYVCILYFLLVTYYYYYPIS